MAYEPEVTGLQLHSSEKDATVDRSPVQANGEFDGLDGTMQHRPAPPESRIDCWNSDSQVLQSGLQVYWLILDSQQQKETSHSLASSMKYIIPFFYWFD